MYSVSSLKVFVSMLLWLVLMGSLSAFYLWQWLHAAHKVSEEHSFFVVQNGESLKSVATRLHQIDLIRWPRVWELYARFYDDASIKKGEYHFKHMESPVNILNRLQSDDVVTYSVTLVEGKTFSDYITQLSTHEKVHSRLLGVDADQQLTLLGMDVEHLEGWFYPDTYQFIAGDTDVTLMRRSHRRMNRFLQDEWRARASGLPYRSPYEALVMASIIEKETGVAYERAKISGVFVRRLQKGMRLQTDPTVIYGLGDEYRGNLTRKHLRTPTPYNTYRIPGLPPTPIAMPSGASIHAALHPEAGDSVYFVAKGDGSHYFSATLDEHNSAVKKYQIKNRKKKYRSAPPSK